MKTGFIGYGEAAYNISLGLGQEGITGIVAYDAMAGDPVMGKLVKTRAEEAKVVLKETAGEIAAECDIIFAAVPSSYTLDVCEAVRDSLNSHKIYVDVSASTPAVKEKIWDAIKETGVLFVDAAMLGSLPKDRHQVPITASGNGAASFKEKMEPFGMKITTVGEKAGAASAIKLIRSIYMKGIASLMIEMAQAADAYGVAEEVISSISKSMDQIPFTSHLDRLVTGSAIHCHRRAAELKGSIDMLKECGLGSEMTAAAKEKLESLEPYRFAELFVEKKPEGWKDIIDILGK